MVGASVATAHRREGRRVIDVDVDVCFAQGAPPHLRLCHDGPCLPRPPGPENDGGFGAAVSTHGVLVIGRRVAAEVAQRFASVQAQDRTCRGGLLGERHALTVASPVGDDWSEVGKNLLFEIASQDHGELQLGVSMS
jgi:hypothetical protein